MRGVATSDHHPWIIAQRWLALGPIVAGWLALVVGGWLRSFKVDRGHVLYKRFLYIAGKNYLQLTAMLHRKLANLKKRIADADATRRHACM